VPNADQKLRSALCTEIQHMVPEIMQVAFCNVFCQQLLFKICWAKYIHEHHDKAIDSVQVAMSSNSQPTVDTND